MNAVTWLLILIAEFGHICGQVFFKLAMNESDESTKRKRGFLPIFAAGIFVMAVSFFIRLGLLSKFDLSFIYPFEALNGVILALGAWLFLKEKMTLSLWIGIVLIGVGVALVSTS